MFHILDNILIFSLFVFAVVMTMRALREQTPEQERKIKTEVEDVLDSPSFKNEGPLS